MPTLTITRESSTKHWVRITDDSGADLETYTCDLMSPRAQRTLAAKTMIPQATIATVAAEVRNSPKSPNAPKPSRTITFCAPDGKGSAEGFEVVLRPKDSSGETGETIRGKNPAEALTAALLRSECDYPDPVIGWAGLEALCCLDIDYHAVAFNDRPSVAALEARAAQTQPRPFAYHVSHGRGCKLYYAATSDFRADELAAVAGIGWVNKDSRASFDLVKFTRHPAFASSGHPGATGGVVHQQTPGTDLAPVAAWLQRTADSEEVTEYLARQGWTVGQRFGHADCLIDPTDTATGEPVVVLNDGVFCHRCEAKGYGCGRRPGFVPFSTLVGGVPPRVATMIRNAVHWTHAKFVLTTDFPTLKEKVLKPAYLAAVKMVHGADSPVVNGVEHSGRELIRMLGRWTSADGTTTITSQSAGLLNELPFTWVSGTRTTDMAKRDLLFQPMDLAKYGYVHVTPVFGCKIYGHHMAYADNRIVFPSPAAHFRGENEKYAPKYRPPGQRMPLDKAWGLVEEVFPGINRNYLLLLIALKGLAEGEAVQSASVIATGPSSTGKSTTVHVAAGLCGDVATEPNYTADCTRLFEAVAESLDKGSFTVLNEIFKIAGRSKLTPIQAIDPILNMTPSTTSHRMYVGPRPLGRLPALVLTDTEIPSTVAGDTQLARRLVWVELERKVDWTHTLGRAGFGGPNRFRLWRQPDASLAADAIVSEVTDRFFREPTTLTEVAKELGFSLLSECADVSDQRDTLRRFFRLVCEAPALTGGDATRFPGAGWKVIDRSDTGELADVWQQLANGLRGEDFYDSRLVAGEDWAGICGHHEPIKFDHNGYRNRLFLRFRIGPKHSPHWASDKLPDWHC